MSKIVPAKNAPPMHPNCHCSTGAHIDDEEYEAWLSFLESGGTTKQYLELNMNNFSFRLDLQFFSYDADKEEIKKNK